MRSTSVAHRHAEQAGPTVARSTQADTARGASRRRPVSRPPAAPSCPCRPSLGKQRVRPSRRSRGRRSRSCTASELRTPGQSQVSPQGLQRSRSMRRFAPICPPRCCRSRGDAPLPTVGAVRRPGSPLGQSRPRWPTWEKGRSRRQPQPLVAPRHNSGRFLDVGRLGVTRSGPRPRQERCREPTSQKPSDRRAQEAHPLIPQSARSMSPPAQRAPPSSKSPRLREDKAPLLRLVPGARQAVPQPTVYRHDLRCGGKLAGSTLAGCREVRGPVHRAGLGILTEAFSC